ncbi:MAG TPA: hypothetical protein VK590_13970 [Saprospiraceae bacterium]|nr:hypothetical protein [Saprospiraceae bacterium]
MLLVISGTLILGIIIGILVSIVVLLATKRYQVPIERTTQRLLNITREQGEVFIDTDEKQDLETFLDGLPKE